MLNVLSFRGRRSIASSTRISKSHQTAFEMIQTYDEWLIPVDSTALKSSNIPTTPVATVKVSVHTKTQCSARISFKPVTIRVYKSRTAKGSGSVCLPSPGIMAAADLSRLPAHPQHSRLQYRPRPRSYHRRRLYGYNSSCALARGRCWAEV